MGFKFSIVIHYLVGKYNNHDYAKLTSFELNFKKLGSNYSCKKIDYACGTVNTFYDPLKQTLSGTTSLKYYSRTVPSSWLAVNIISYDQVKSMVGASVHAIIQEKNSSNYYEFDFVCLIDSWTFDMFKNGSSSAIYFGHGTYSNHSIII